MRVALGFCIGILISTLFWLSYAVLACENGELNLGIDTYACGLIEFE